MSPSSHDEDSPTACISCSKSKRRCSRQVPSCRRCRVQGRRCTYPTAARRVRPSDSSSPGPFHSSSDTHAPHGDRSIVVARSLPTAISSPQAQSPADFDRHVTQPWFLAPLSWEIDRIPAPENDRITFPTSGLDFFLDNVRTWLDQFTSKNHCAFMHAGLYGSELPSPLQHALAAWQVYRAAVTPTSHKIALRIATDWSQNLVNEVFVADSLQGSGGTPSFADCLARVQALLVYQVIGLYDGDVRARAHSEELLGTLTTWADALLASAAAEVSNTRVLPESPQAIPSNLQPQNRSQLHPDGTPASAWRSWIRSESARRVWMVATFTECAFLIMKQGFATCPGGIYVTAREGLWNATSAKEWIEAISKRSNVQTPVQMSEFDAMILDKVAASDVDEFIQTILAYGRGSEAVEQWRDMGNE